VVAVIELAVTSKKGNPTTVKILSTSDGHLMCQLHRQHWCDHVKEAIQSDLEVADLWSEVGTQNELGYDVTTVMVPYCPVLNVWAKVDLRVQAGEGRVAWLVPPDGGGAERLGILFPGEGRNILRQMIHNWFVPKQYNLVGRDAGTPIKLRCRASSHAPVQQNELTTNLHSENTEWGERWLIFYTGMCHACVVIQSDIADLVPGAF
jgi:hypothetical protein